MSLASRNMLLNGQYSFLHRPDDTEPPPSPGLPVSGAWFFGPIIPALGATESVYSIIIETLRGSPSAATLEAKFQSVSQTTQGSASTSYFTDARPGFFDVDDLTLLPDGAWPAKLFDLSVDTTFANLATAVAATNTEITSTGGKKITRRIRGGVDHRLALKPTFTGGTSPGFRLTIEMLTRYG